MLIYDFAIRTPIQRLIYFGADYVPPTTLRCDLRHARGGNAWVDVGGGAVVASHGRG